MRAIERIVATMPMCAVSEIEITDLGEKDENGNLTVGMAYEDKMKISTRTRRDELQFTVAHECGHIADYLTPEHDRLKRAIFGRPPYFTEYSKVDRYEDFADAYAHHLLFEEGTRRKRLAIMKIITPLQ